MRCDRIRLGVLAWPRCSISFTRRTRCSPSTGVTLPAARPVANDPAESFRRRTRDPGADRRRRRGRKAGPVGAGRRTAHSALPLHQLLRRRRRPRWNRHPDAPELLTFSMLAALGGCDAQVKAHVTANLHVGNDRARLIDVATQLLPFIGYPPHPLNAIRAIDESAPA